MIKNLRDLKTPCFVFDEGELKANFLGFRDALQKAWGCHAQVAYSVKTNPLPWMLGVARSCHAWAEVVSDEEYNVAHQAGFSPSEIVFNGPIKGQKRFCAALLQGSVVNLDSERELRWVSELAKREKSLLKVGLRVNLNLEKYCPGQTLTGSAGGRFGYCYENGEFARAVAQLSKAGDSVRLCGLHVHVTTKSRSIEVYQVLARFAVRLAKEFRLSLEYIDMGGGFYGGGPHNEGAYEAYANAISAELRDGFDPATTRLIVEPGGAVVCTPARYLGRVLDTKDTEYGRFVTTDFSRVNIDHEMKKTSYPLEVVFADSNVRPLLSSQVIGGFSCMESDRLCNLYNQPELREGDLMIISHAGAYSMSFTPGFFIRFAPAVYTRTLAGEYVEVGNASWRS